MKKQREILSKKPSTDLRAMVTQKHTMVKKAKREQNVHNHRFQPFASSTRKMQWFEIRTSGTTQRWLDHCGKEWTKNNRHGSYARSTQQQPQTEATTHEWLL